MFKNDPRGLLVLALPEGGQCLSLAGEWRMPQLSVLQQAVSILDVDWLNTGSTALGNTKVGRLLIDLTEATYLDSTIFGMLAGVAQRYAQYYDRQPILRLRSGFVRNTVKTLSFDQLFTVLLCNEDEGDAISAPNAYPVDLAVYLEAGSIADRSDVTCLFKWSCAQDPKVDEPKVILPRGKRYGHRSPAGQAVIEAHETLANLSEENRQVFCPVLDALHHELTDDFRSEGK